MLLKAIASTATALMLISAAPMFTASADNFGAQPANYEASVTDYVHSRLTNTRGAKIKYVSTPYRVYTDMRGYEGLACWAIDVRIKSKLPSGGYGGYLPYTVLFLDGDVIAFERDVKKVTRL